MSDKPSQNSEHRRSVRPGIPDIVLMNIAGVILHADGSLEIPYYGLDGKPIGHSRTRLPYVRTNGQKYDQPKGSGSHVYLPPMLQELLDTNNGEIIPAGSCCLGEGEFKATALACVRIPGIGLPGLYACKAIKDENGRTIAREVLDDLLAVIQTKEIKTLYFIGDADTAHNFLFSFEAWTLAKATQKLGVEVFLPRLDVGGPKGIDDIKETFIGTDVSFKEFFKKLIEDAIPLDPDNMSPQALALLLLQNQEENFPKLVSTEEWPHIQSRLAKTCAWAQICRNKDDMNTNRLIAAAAKISGQAAAQFKEQVDKERAHLLRELRREEPEPKEAKTPSGSSQQTTDPDESRKTEQCDSFSNRREETQEEPRPLLPMRSWIYYSDLEVDITRFLVGRGFLEPGCFVVLIGASYAGKSTLSAQMSIVWAMGQPSFGIDIQRPLRTIFFQAEDSENKLIKIGHLCRRMNLTPEQRKLVDENTAVVTLQGIQDAASIAEMRRHAEVFKPDIIIVNPLTSFLSKGVYDEAGLNDFLRGGFPSILREFNCGGFPIHHPPKPSGKNPNEQTIYELQYMGAGMAAITNACRGSLILLPVDEDVFALCGGKGFHELGWTKDRIYLRRSIDVNGDWLWLPCEDAKAQEATEKNDKRAGKKEGNGGRAKFVSYDQILKLFKPTDKFPPEKVQELVKREIDRGENWAKAAMKQMVHERRLVKTIHKHSRGQPLVFYHLPTVLEPAPEDGLPVYTQSDE